MAVNIIYYNVNIININCHSNFDFHFWITASPNTCKICFGLSSLQNKYSILLHGVQVLASPCKLLLPISAGDCFCQWNGTCSINSESNINKGKRKWSPWSRKSLWLLDKFSLSVSLKMSSKQCGYYYDVRV